jgi:hypothetical protein
MRDGLSRDVSNLQTSKLKPAVQQNRTPALSPDSLLLTVPGGLPPPSLRAAHVTDPRAMQPLQVEVSTDVLAPPTSRHNQGNPEDNPRYTSLDRPALRTVPCISYCDQQKITRQSLPGHQEGPCSQHLASCHCSYVLHTKRRLHLKCYEPRHLVCLLLRLSLSA